MRFAAIIALAMASVAVAQSGTTWISEIDCQEIGDETVCYYYSMDAHGFIWPPKYLFLLTNYDC